MARKKKEGISGRKSDHIILSLSEESQNKGKGLFEDVVLLNRALPELSLSEVSASTTLLGKKVSAPIVVSSMSGGTALSGKLNSSIARACERLELGFSVGSQRIALENPSRRGLFEVRKFARNSPVFANLGLASFIGGGFRPNAARDAVEMIGADGIFIHLNPAQEIVQKGGDRNFSDGASILEEIVDCAGVPVFAKEVGCGISGTVARRLVDAGISGIDVGGLGGTSFTKIESMRGGEEIGSALSDWGIPTLASVAECSDLPVPVIASGGLSTGVDVAKAISLGAWGGGFAREILLAHSRSGERGIEEFLSLRIGELKAAMFLTGSKDLESLARAEKRVFGRLSEWISQKS